MIPVNCLSVDYLSVDELTARDSGWADVMGVALFSRSELANHGQKWLDAGDVPVARVTTQPLAAGKAASDKAVCEVWRAPGPYRSSKSGSVHYRASDQLLFGCVEIQEVQCAGTNGPAAQLATAVERAYRELFSCVTQAGFPEVLRIWNYMSDITLEVSSTERYRTFNEARQKAFEAFHRDVKGAVPAACALGTPSSAPLVIYFIAARERGIAIENPRQVSAYDYPKEYGSFSPTFSRASLHRARGHAALLVSGTSSIVGHRTVHVDDVVGQARETVANMRAVIAEANRCVASESFAASSMKYKVYIRRPEDHAVINAELTAALEPEYPIVYLKADICRPRLLIEIEAFGAASHA